MTPNFMYVRTYIQYSLAHHTCVLFFKISHVCRHLHRKLTCSAHMLIAVIVTSYIRTVNCNTLAFYNSGHTYIFYAYTRDLRLMLTQKHYYIIPIIFVTIITNQIKVSSDKHVLATLNFENCVHT